MTQLAAVYALGIAKNHPFVDGNKRTAWVLCATFLELNGRRVTAAQTAVLETMMRVAAGSVSDEAMALWLDKNSR